ncbi:MAG: hypothetical protein JNN04_07330 [Cyclobacteriaceae bacterium]|nr:hypothetical protein [Cyclobacteriaceae bacterium]
MTGRGLLILAVILALPLRSATAQGPERCSTTRYEEQRRSQRPGRETPAEFEQWIQSRLAAKKSQLPQLASATYTIPVVVHVLHNGVTDITNISEAQIASQIQVLNADFRRLNLDASNTPAEFLPVAGSLDIEFVLAKRDPEGRETNGITRTQGTKPQWSLADQSEFKSLSYWPAEDYLNIWVVNFGTNDIGYAQFPVSNNLAGLEMASEDRLTDGIVVDYRAFGTIDAGPFPLMAGYNKGRTTTHEIGHFFGLRHIWGDVSSCGDNDFVADTPPQLGASSFCPTHPQASCSTNKMFMNYMDYTYDACMNLFTAGQFARMLVVLAESPRRASLLVSPGSIPPPAPVANDLGIKSILSPGATACGSSANVQIEVRNYGTNTITSTTIEVAVTGPGGSTTQLPFTLNLAPQAITTLTFPPLALNAGSSYGFTFQVISTNGGVDGNNQNNTKSSNTTALATTGLPLVEQFTSLPSNWSVSNPDNQVGWTNVLAPDNSPSNRAMRLEFYSYQNEGVLDILYSPAFSLAVPSSSQLKFDVAYAQFPGQNNDALKVYALPACNQNLEAGILLYDKSGPTLATTSSTSQPFLPLNALQWRKSEILSLAGLSSSTPWQLAFVGRNGYGNNLYVDNVVVTENEIVDIAFAGVISPGIVHCDPNPVIQFKVTNLGTSPIYSFRTDVQVNGIPTPPQFAGNFQLDVGETETVSLNPVNLNQGQNEVRITISLPNDIPDIVTNNSYTLYSVLDLTTDKAPLRVTFDSPKETLWRVASPNGAADWEQVSTNKELSLTYRSFTNPSIGQESWLVSPMLDLRAGTFSLFFDVSYAQNVPADDRLLILASTDCGVHYSEVLMDRAASTFSSATSSNEWIPGTNDDWRREYVDLGSLGFQSNVRLAFVARNDNGNNLYLDNLEIFAGDDPNPPKTSAKYQFYYSSQNSQADVALTLNLAERQDVPLQILDLQGRLVAEHLLADALNQTYYFNLGQVTPGLYLFRMIVDNIPTATKVFIGH